MRSIAFIGLLALFTGNFSHAQEPKFKLSDKNVSQGDVAILRRIDGGADTFKVSFLGREYESFLFGNRQSVLIGIHFQLRPGRHALIAQSDHLAGGTTSFVFTFNVRELYPELKFEPPKRPEAEQKRINEENENKISALRNMNLRVDRMNYFIHSVYPARVNSPFGDLRPSACNNKRLRKKLNCWQHRGTDYRSAFDFFHQKAEPARAINSGRVVEAADNLLDGKIVILDHGNGISSEYLHLSKFLVKKGDLVVRGQKIGITGKTGATDAIHLHLTIKMDYGETLVDPEVFLKTLSK